MRKTLALVLALSLVWSLAACGNRGRGGSSASPDPAGSSSGEPLRLDVIISQYSDRTEEWWSGFEADFEAENRDVDLNLEIVSWNDLYDVVQTRIRTRNPPDILNIDTFADYVKEDLLMSAREYTSAELKGKMIPAFWNSSEMDGTVWALPILASVRALFYNTDILAAAGVEQPPTTWEEVREACARIRTALPEIIPWSLDLSKDEGQAAFGYYTWNFGGGFTDDEGNWALNSPENVAAMAYVRDLYEAGYCYPDALHATRYPQQEAFSQGRLAMMIGPCNLVLTGSLVPYGVIPQPSLEGRPLNLGIGDRLMVFRDDDAPDPEARTAAISRFFDFFYETDRYSEYMVYEGFLPVTVDASEYLAINAAQFTRGGSDTPGDPEYFQTFCAMLADCVFYPASKAEWVTVKQGIIQAEQKIIGEGEDPQTVLDTLQGEILRLQGQNSPDSGCS